eukprot:CAMPEP_0116994126 /NCGR_PEP_ID=MMETSP0467-20121206/67914_1 /TAXON_ID=283647 /ORGANISM="Mesodinium pulex, Strain SPMC105" /LENGTH=405 /DNA_ID=CAMNT_0004692073 /DNA_START=258 /DNA_END=1478 /DNA_ORIENTATION=+
MDRDHLPVVDLGTDLSNARDKILLKDSSKLDEDDIMLLNAKERVNLAKFKVAEIKKQMKDEEVKEKLDLQKADNILDQVVGLDDFKLLDDSKKLQVENDLCNNVLQNPKTDLDKISIIIPDLVVNKASLCSMTLILLEITPDYACVTTPTKKWKSNSPKKPGDPQPRNQIQKHFQELRQNPERVVVHEGPGVGRVEADLSHLRVQPLQPAVALQLLGGNDAPGDLGLFNIPKNVAVRTKSSECLHNLSKSTHDHDIKHKFDMIVEIYNKLKLYLKSKKSKNVPNDVVEIVKNVELIKVDSIVDEDEEEKLNELELKRKRKEEETKGLTYKQKKLIERLDKEKKMKKAKKHAAERIVAKKAKEQVKKDLNKLKGDVVSAKIKKDFMKRTLEVVTKICLLTVLNADK